MAKIPLLQQWLTQTEEANAAETAPLRFEVLKSKLKLKISEEDLKVSEAKAKFKQALTTREIDWEKVYESEAAVALAERRIVVFKRMLQEYCEINQSSTNE